MYGLFACLVSVVKRKSQIQLSDKEHTYVHMSVYLGVSFILFIIHKSDACQSKIAYSGVSGKS